MFHFKGRALEGSGEGVGSAGDFVQLWVDRVEDLPRGYDIESIVNTLSIEVWKIVNVNVVGVDNPHC